MTTVQELALSLLHAPDSDLVPIVGCFLDALQESGVDIDFRVTHVRKLGKGSYSLVVTPYKRFVSLGVVFSERKVGFALYFGEAKYILTQTTGEGRKLKYITLASDSWGVFRE